MSKRTVLNEDYKGLVESFSIPAELHERDGKKFASFGSTVPIHCCTPEEIAERAKTTHHYCDVFTEQLMAPLEELAFVRLDENTAEKVFINRTKRLLIRSSDGELAQWRCAPTFESSNQYMAGTPVVSRAGQLVSVVTARRGNHYAVSTFEGEGGYFWTGEAWRVVEARRGSHVYGDRVFDTREELRAHLAALGPPPPAPLRPVLVAGPSPRVSLLAPGGRQLAHLYLQNVLTDNIDYL